MTSSNIKANKSVHFEKETTKKAQPLQTDESKKSTAKDHQPQNPVKVQKSAFPPPAPEHSQYLTITGFIIGDDECVEASHMLIDSRASSCFISLEATHLAKLEVHSLPPVYFKTANGQTYYTKYVNFPLRLAAIQHTIVAYVDERQNCPRHMVLGMPAIEKFRIMFHPPSQGEEGVGISVKSDVAGQRHKHYYLQPDDPKIKPILRLHDSLTGWQLAMRRGETAAQRKAHKEVVRKTAALEKAVQKLRTTRPT